MSMLLLADYHEHADDCNPCMMELARVQKFRYLGIMKPSMLFTRECSFATSGDVI
jgi:hypothetical protein